MIEYGGSARCVSESGAIPPDGELMRDMFKQADYELGLKRGEFEMCPEGSGICERILPLSVGKASDYYFKWGAGK